jgi:hypothetical protein
MVRPPVVGSSLASSISGEPRSTLDVEMSDADGPRVVVALPCPGSFSDCEDASAEPAGPITGGATGETVL